MSEPASIQWPQGAPRVEYMDSVGEEELPGDNKLFRMLATLATEQEAPPTTQRYHENKARDILNGISEYRIEPIRIKITDDEPRGKGGQGVVMIGTLFPHEAYKKAGLEGIEELLSSQWEEVVSEIYEERPPDGRKQAELRKLLSAELGERTRERQVAVKKLEWPRDNAEESTKFFKSFVNELSVMASISHAHPNIITFLGFVEDIKKGDAWIVLPWEPNGNVREFLQSGEWDLPERVSLIKDTAMGLEYLHTHNPPICHGDLKSLNVLVNSSYQAVITDFGSSRFKPNSASENGYKAPGQMSLENDRATKAISSEAKFNGSKWYLTLTGPAFSIRWAAPEVFSGEVQDLASDMWQIGWICWEIVTGSVPFEGENTEAAIINRAVHGEMPAIREDTHLSHVLMLCSLMSDCWVPQPARRIDASSFQRKIGLLPSETPVPSNPGDEKERTAGLLMKRGIMYKRQNRLEEAEKHFRLAIEVATRTKDEVGLANALNGLGDVYSRRSDYGEAEGCYKEAQEIHRGVGDDYGAANALYGLGATYTVQSRYQEAEKAFNAAYEIDTRIGYDLGAANALHGLGKLHGAQSRYQEAEKALNAAHEIHTRIGDDLGAAYALEDLGKAYGSQSRQQEAEKAFNAAHEIHTRMGHDLGAAYALGGLGETYRLQSRYQEAEKAFNTAHEIHNRIGNHLGSANALESLGKIYRAQSKNQEAQNALNRAHDIYSRIGHHLDAANALRSLGVLYTDQRNYSESELSYRRALASYSRAHDGDSSATTLLALGNLFYTQHKYLEAEEAAMEALAIWTSIADDQGQARASLLLSKIFRSQSKHNKEMDALIQAEAAFSQTVDHTSHAAILDRLGDIQVEQCSYAEAEESYRRAQAIFLSIDDSHGEATELRSLGRLYALQDRYAEAEEFYVQARHLCANIPYEEGELEALDGLMAALSLQGKFRDSKVACKEAREIYARIGRPMSNTCGLAWEFLQQIEES